MAGSHTFRLPISARKNTHSRTPPQALTLACTHMTMPRSFSLFLCRRSCNTVGLFRSAWSHVGCRYLYAVKPEHIWARRCRHTGHSGSTPLHRRRGAVPAWGAWRRRSIGRYVILRSCYVARHHRQLDHAPARNQSLRRCRGSIKRYRVRRMKLLRGR